MALIPRKYYSTPLNLSLSLALGLFLTTNFALLYTNHHSLPASFYGNQDAHSVLLSAQGAQGWVDNVYNDEYWEQFAHELENAKRNEILTNLKTSLRTTYYQQFVAELRDSIRIEMLPLFEAQLKLQIEQHHKHRLLQAISRSYSLLDEAKQEYLEQHQREIRQEVVNDVVGNAKVDAMVNRQAYYQYIIGDLIESGPTMGGLPKTPPVLAPIHAKFVRSPTLSRNELAALAMSFPQFRDLQQSHDRVVAALMTSQPPLFWRGDGIVVFAGQGSFASKIALALLVVRRLRDLGSQLPVEVVFTNDLDRNVCNRMSALDAHCISIEHEIGTEALSQILHLQPLALLVSSFDNTILLDCHSVPLNNVDDLLVSPSFSRSKWLMWPHIWQRTTSPTYYQVAHLSAGEPVRRDCVDSEQLFANYIASDVCLNDLDGLPPTTTVNAALMVVSKRLHHRPVLLLLYYSLFGTSHYQQLLEQHRDPTFGESYIAALHVFDEPYTLVRYLPQVTKGGALVQHNPAMAMDYLGEWRAWLALQKLDTRLNTWQQSRYTKQLVEAFGRTGAQPPPPYLVNLGKPYTAGAADVLGEEAELALANAARWVACEMLNACGNI